MTKKGQDKRRIGQTKDKKNEAQDSTNEGQEKRSTGQTKDRTNERQD